MQFRRDVQALPGSMEQQTPQLHAMLLPRCVCRYCEIGYLQILDIY